MKTDIHFIISRSFLLRMRLFHAKLSRRSNHVLCSITFYFFQNRAVYEIMWKNNVEADRPQKTKWRMRIACRILKATNPHSKYLIFIAFQPQQWLHKRASMLCYTYTACLFFQITSIFPRTIRPLFYTHICLNVTLIGRKSGRGLETFNKVKDLADMWQH
jgi:hypothetical protein